jgi:hypothetical protein
MVVYDVGRTWWSTRPSVVWWRRLTGTLSGWSLRPRSLRLLSAVMMATAGGPSEAVVGLPLSRVDMQRADDQWPIRINVTEANPCRTRRLVVADPRSPAFGICKLNNKIKLKMRSRACLYTASTSNTRTHQCEEAWCVFEAVGRRCWHAQRPLLPLRPLTSTLPPFILIIHSSK